MAQPYEFGTPAASYINEDYAVQYLTGWAGPKLAEEAFDVFGDQFIQFQITGQRLSTAGRRMMLYEVTRKLLGKDTPNYAQQIGDCVSFGAKNAIEYLMAVEKFLLKQPEAWKPVFPPYLYGTGRVFAGGSQISGDGSTGAWQAAAVMKYGVLRSDERGVPTYSGQIAREWGNRPGPPEKFVQIAKLHPVKSAARLRSWSQCVDAIVNGYPVTIASNQGFNMQPSSDGFHYPGPDDWPHQMCITGIDDEYRIPYAIILNSWGNSHGTLRDFKTEQTLPAGCLRVRAELVNSMINSGEAYAYSDLTGFEEKLPALDEALFDVIGA